MFLKTRGFTLAEVLIVTAIIALMSTIAFVNYQEGRKQARDQRRLADIEQLALAARLHREQYGQFPCDEDDAADVGDCQAVGLYSDDINGPIGEGRDIDDWFASYLETVPVDPIGTGAGGAYIYDAWHECQAGSGEATHKAIIVIQSLETLPGNYAAVCDGNGTAGSGGSDWDADENDYVIVLGDSEF